MSIITPTDFTGQYLIAQIEQEDVSNSVKEFIDKYEPIFLRELLGFELASEFITGLIPIPVDPPTIPPTYEPVDPIWIALRDEMGLKEMLKAYVYWFYQEDNVTSTVGTGEGKLKKDNAAAASPLAKMTRNWNEMVNEVRFFDLSTETYPSYVRVYWRNWWCGCNWRLPEIYKFKNQLGL